MLTLDPARLYNDRAPVGGPLTIYAHRINRPHQRRVFERARRLPPAPVAGRVARWGAEVDVSFVGGGLRACWRPDAGATPLAAHLEALGPDQPILLDLRASMAAPGAVERLQDVVQGWPGPLIACSFDHRLIARLDPSRGPDQGFASWLLDASGPRHMRLAEAAGRVVRLRRPGRIAVQYALFPGPAPRLATRAALAGAGVRLIVGNVDSPEALGALSDPRICGALTDSLALFAPGRSIPSSLEYT